MAHGKPHDAVADSPLLGIGSLRTMAAGGDDKPRILVLADLRIPSEKAHSLHLVKMCEAFAATGADVELVYSHRRQDPRLAGVSIYDYYKVPETFSVREIRGFDVVPLELVAPRLVPPVFAVRASGWALYAATVVRRSRPDLCFTTNHEVRVLVCSTRRPDILGSAQGPASHRPMVRASSRPSGRASGRRRVDDGPA